MAEGRGYGAKVAKQIVDLDVAYFLHAGMQSTRTRRPVADEVVDVPNDLLTRGDDDCWCSTVQCSA